jgi:stage III sporulation protein AG
MIKIPKPISIAKIVAPEPQIPEPAPEISAKPAAKNAPAVAPSGQNVSRGTFLSKLKNLKHAELYVVAGIIAVIFLIFVSSFGANLFGKSAETSANLSKTEDAFVRDMEQKLIATLSKINGAGRVQVMVTAVGSATLEIAYNLDEKTITQGNGGASTTTTAITKTPVMVGGKPVVLMEAKPKLRGVVIIASGADNPTVRLAIMRAVQTLVADASVKIEILC